jgi:hypothetical protein
MEDLDMELSILEEKLVELREESMRQKSFQSPMPVTTQKKDRVRDSDVGEAHFSGEFQDIGKSPTLDSALGKHTKTSAEKSTGQYHRGTYKDTGASSCVYRGQELDYAREKERPHITKSLDLAILQGNFTKIVKMILFPL